MDADRGTPASRPLAARIAAELNHRNQSLYLGRSTATGEAVFGSSEDHALALGIARSGKSSRVFVPSVAVHPGPVVVTSIRDDVLIDTASARRAIAETFGGQVGEVAFGGAATGRVPTLGWSCTDGCRNWNTARDRADTLCGAAIPNREDRFWRNAGADLLAACLYGAAWLGEDDRQVARRLEVQDIHDYHVAAFESRGEADKASEIFTRFREETSAMAADTRASVFVTLTSQVLAQFSYDVPHVVGELSIEDFVRSWGTLYITVPDERARKLGPVVTAFVAAVATAWSASHAVSEKPSRGTLLLALDEVANVAPLPRLPGLITAGAGDGIQCLLGMQDPGQASRWEGESSVVLKNTTHTVLFPGLPNVDYLENASRLQPQVVSYDEQAEVVKNTPNGVRFADHARLIRERMRLESALRDEPTRWRSVRATQIAASIASERLRDGIKSRCEDEGTAAAAVLSEIMKYTVVRLVPQRRSMHEVPDLAKGREDACFVMTRSQGEYRRLVHWRRDETWRHVVRPLDAAAGL